MIVRRKKKVKNKKKRGCRTNAGKFFSWVGCGKITNAGKINHNFYMTLRLYKRLTTPGEAKIEQKQSVAFCWRSSSTKKGASMRGVSRA